MNRLSHVIYALAAASVCFSATTPTPTASRVTEVVDGITFEFPENRRDIVLELAPRLVAFNAELGKLPAAPAVAPRKPGDTQDLREHRTEYLARIAGSLGLEKPTALQEDCFDGYLENFAATDQMLELLNLKFRQMMVVRRIQVWDKADLIARLKRGEKIADMSLDPDGEHGHFEFESALNNLNTPELQGLFTQRNTHRLDYSMNWTVKDGIATISGQSSWPKKGQPSKPSAASTPSAAPSGPMEVPFPVIITPDEKDQTAAEIANQAMKFYDTNIGPARTRRIADQLDNTGPRIYLICHETTEVGVVDRYIGSRDRRWFCEGVANYVAMQVAREIGGEALAKQVYDLPAQLAQAAPFAKKINLRRWPAAENQKKEDQESPLNRAHYAYATRAVMLMVARGGENILPKLFMEIGQTPRNKVSMRTIENAYKGLTGANLSDILADAMKPVPGIAAPKAKG